MNKFISISVIFTSMIGVSVTVWAENPCLPIAEACMQAGYYKGGYKVGKGLVKNCVMPVATRHKTLPNVTFGDETLQQCKALLLKKMH